MLVKVLIGVAALLVLFLVVVAFQSPTFHIERSITMAAPPEKAFATVNDFHRWSLWSPWEQKDPAMQKTFAGAPTGVGAVYSWVGNKEVGEGRMTIERSEPARQIAIKLEFFKPFPGTSTATYTFAPVGAGTKVTWAMDGTSSFMMKAFHLVVNMDKLLGADFERGLAALKNEAEKQS